MSPGHLARRAPGHPDRPGGRRSDASPTVVFLFVLQVAMGNRNWIQMVLIATIMDVVMYVVMRYGFGVPVPGPQLV